MNQSNDVIFTSLLQPYQNKYSFQLIPTDKTILAMCIHFNIEFDLLKKLESFNNIVGNHVGNLVGDDIINYIANNGIEFDNIYNIIDDNILIKEDNFIIMNQVLMNDEQRNLLETQILFCKPWNLISKRSLLAVKRLRQDAIELNLRVLRTVDNGDCFFDAFSKCLNKINMNVSVKDLRKIVSDFVHNDYNETQIKEFKRILGRSYNEWYNFVHEEYNEARKNGRDVVWGQYYIDGKILVDHFKVNLRILSEIFLYESNVEAKESGLSGLDDEENRVSGDVLLKPTLIKLSPTRSPTKLPTKLPTLVVGNIPGHFFAII